MTPIIIGVQTQISPGKRISFNAAEVTSETQVIAIYGKGGSGKSFALSNLSYMMAQQGKRVLLIGCDPKSDTTSLLFGGKSCPTIIETSSKKKLAGEEVTIEDVCFQRDGVFAMELGGPEVGRGCGGRGWAFCFFFPQLFEVFFLLPAHFLKKKLTRTAASSRAWPALNRASTL